VRDGGRTVRIATDITPAQHGLLKARADAEGLTLASYLYLQIGVMVNADPSSSEEVE
jgi:hypothetical protein